MLQFYKIQNKILYTESEIYELEQLAFNKFKNGSDVQQVINELRAGVIIIDFEIAFAIVLAGTVLYIMHVNGVQGFTPIHYYPPRFNEWGNVKNDRPLHPSHFSGYVKGVDTKSIKVIGDPNSGLERNRIENAYNEIPDLSVNGTNNNITPCPLLNTRIMVQILD